MKSDMPSHKELCEADPDFKAWHDFCHENPIAVAKAMVVFEKHMADKYSKRSIFQTGLQAIWMTFLVATCISAFAPMVGQFAGMVIGVGAVILVDKTMESTSKLLIGFLNKKKFEALERMTKDDGDSSADDSKTD